MMRRRILVTGGSGLLGSNIARLAVKDSEVYATYNYHRTLIPGCKFIPLDVREKPRVLSVFRDTKPHLVIHTAALASVDYCEEHPEEAWTTNVEGTENVAGASKEIGARLIHISTDSVFDGKKGMYSEQDVPLPVNAYARTKLEGEKRVQHLVPDSIIVRTAFYGWGLNRRTSLSEWVVDNLREGKHLNMFTDVFFSPIFLDDLVRIMLKMYHQNLAGVYHVGSSEWCSKYDFGRGIAEAFGCDAANISPGSIESAGLTAPRPNNLSLNVAKLSRELGIQLPGIREGIERFKKLEPEVNALREMQCAK
jgi:dTDP-4-dehydrorhamnose reductase